MKDNLLNYIKSNDYKKAYKDNTVVNISSYLQIPKSRCSILLNQLLKEEKIVRVEEKPYFYITAEYIKQILGISINKYVFSHLQELLEKNKPRDFMKLIGYNYSLKDMVNKCKATVSYPPKGLPMLLYGPTGTGKSLVAKLTYEWAINQGILPPKSRFVTVNCSEYANNPELLTANLFGYVKGAFTGAEKDSEGLLSLAAEGILFLDEVHELKAECQEKLFTYMDQGIYHRVGDNEKWYSSNARIICATTEEPSEVLLKTLLRRIPMIITIPALSERSTQERIEFIYEIFSKEEKRIGVKIRLSMQVYSILLKEKFSGNIGELQSVIQSSCINSLFEREGDIVTIRLKSLPKSLLNDNDLRLNVFEDKEYIFIKDLKQQYDQKKEIIGLNNSILHCYKDYLIHKDTSKLMVKGKEIVQDFFDSIILKENDGKENRYYLTGIDSILNIMDNRYGFKVTNNERVAMAHYLKEVVSENSDFYNWYLQNEEACEDLNALLQNEYYRTTNIALELCTYLKSYLDIDMLPIIVDTFIFYLYNPLRMKKIEQKACVIVAHGYSTASSMAEACNQLLGEYIFDSLDMPIHVDTQMIVDRLNSYLKHIGNIKEMYLLVDMGSLTEIYNGINLNNVNIGIMDNTSTPIALEIGNGIIQNIDMSELLKKVSQETKCSYRIEKRQTKKNIILCSCASGIETSHKIKAILEESIPKDVNLEIRIQDYSFLISQKENNPMFDEHNVLFMIGTLNPYIKDLAYVGIEDLIMQGNYDGMKLYFKGIMNDDEIDLFNKNILKKFSLSNLMNVLTILNPTKLLEQVANAIDALQTYLRVQLSSRTCFGLYIHVCTMIERLIISKEHNGYEECSEFEINNSSFVEFTRRALKPVENFYHVEIPLEEIKYIYLYVENDDYLIDY